MIDASENKRNEYKACICRLAELDSPIYKSYPIVEVVAEIKTGLGEVIHDYAHQTLKQLTEIIATLPRYRNNTATLEEIIIVERAGYVLKMVGKFLEIVPSAMRRNTISEITTKEKITIHDIAKIYQEFVASKDIQYLIALEESRDMITDATIQ